MPEKPKTPADTELLRDLSGLLEQSHQSGAQITGNIEIATVRMQAVKEISRAIDQLRIRRNQIFEKQNVDLKPYQVAVAQCETKVAEIRREIASIREAKVVAQQVCDEHGRVVPGYFMQWIPAPGNCVGSQTWPQSNRSVEQMKNAFIERGEGSLKFYLSRLESVRDTLRHMEQQTRSAELSIIDREISELQQRLDRLFGLPPSQSK
ncbi:MAG: hypothetical protein PHU04_03195 [Candidatus Peribacteraceae bacterium]|nr:hypothetical protein [Candidatus Peribacteraceae bacterium]